MFGGASSSHARRPRYQYLGTEFVPIGGICTLDRHFYQEKVREYCGERMIEIMDDVELLRRLRKLAEESEPF
jgi:hypothetical protein